MSEHHESARTYITTRFRFEYFHSWPDAPYSRQFLAHHHRHEFHVEVRLEVFHDEREIEFQTVKRWLQNSLDRLIELHEFDVPFLDPDFFEQVVEPLMVRVWEETASCEHIARLIALWLGARYGFVRGCSVEVLEDGESGAIFIHEGAGR